MAPAPAATGPSFTYDPQYAREPFAIPFEAWQANYSMNVLGPMRLFKAVLPHLQQAGGGAFVAMSGIEALQPRLPYVLGPNRLALHGFAELLADRYGRDHIRVNCIAPGLMANAAAAFRADWVAQVPLGRHGELREVAGTVAYLLADDARYVTGQTIVIDGGVNRSTGL